MRIAVVHYTSEGPGGVEGVIAAQRDVLVEQGHEVVVVSGDGETSLEHITIPGLNPARPFDTDIREKLEATLSACQAVVLHNVLLLDSLHLALSEALWKQIDERPNVNWLAWSHDVPQCLQAEPGQEPVERVTWVTDTEAAKHDLALLLRLDPDHIQSVPPPLPAGSWLALGDQARQLAAQLCLDMANALIFVPAKLLPHKNLERVVGLGAALKELGALPKVLITGPPSPHQPKVSREVACRLRELIQTRGLDEEVYLLSDILGSSPDAETVRNLILLADLVFLPSSKEGYGMPLLEAASLRVPVLAADIPAFREVGGDGICYFSLDTPDDDLAVLALDLTERPANRLRRKALASRQAFAESMKELVAPPAGANAPLR